MTEPTEYRIETVTDMLKVPRDKWPAMLADVQAWLEMRDDLQPLIETGFMQVEPYVQWFDDGQTGLSELTIEVVDSLTATPTSMEGERE